MSQSDAPLLFFSHSSQDAELLKFFVKAARMGLNLRAEDIRFSSEDAYGFEPGVSITESTRREATGAAILVGVITPNSLKSGWVKTELDARWGAGKEGELPSYLVIANGTDFKEIPAPHQDKLAKACTVKGLESLFEVIAKKLDKHYDYQTAREFLEDAETFSNGMAAALEDEPGDTVTGHKSSAKVAFKFPHNGAIKGNPVKYSIECKKLPASSNTLWLCVEIETKVWPKHILHFNSVGDTVDSSQTEGGSSKYFFLTVIEVGPEGQKQIKDWEASCKEKGDYPGMEGITGALLDHRLVIKQQ